jgi:hypothetical protein
MTSFKFLGAALVFSALLATPASAWEPAAAEAADPTFSIYSGMYLKSCSSAPDDLDLSQPAEPFPTKDLALRTEFLFSRQRR